MASPQDAKALQTEFGRTYELGRARVLREIERRVLGTDYGATSWTTREEANDIAARLQLAPRIRLLDLGAGSGWPGLYFAQRTGCDVVLVDVPLSGLRVAAERASRDGIEHRCTIAVAAGDKLPLPDRCVDAITHSDVLCCLPDKRETLRECARVARPDARMAFSVITLASALSDAQRAIALQGGPVFVESVTAYAALLAQTGWHLHEHADVTDRFVESLRKLVSDTEEFAADLLQIYGATDYAARLTKRRTALAASEQKWLRRQLFIATRST